jgi:hypothetical protein
MILRCYRSTLDGRLMPFAEQSNNTQMISNHALHGGCRHECSIARPPPLYIWSSGNNGSINDDVEWGFPFKRRHCPNLTTRFLSSSLLPHSTHIALLNNLRYHDRYVGLILSIRLHWLVSGTLTRKHMHIQDLHASTPRNTCTLTRTLLTRLIYFSITRTFIPTLTAINRQPFRMSSFSNTDTGSKTADPYTAKNLQDPSLKEKVEDLQAFVDKSKFCMMTTKTQDGLLASRCMAVAARVSLPK